MPGRGRFTSRGRSGRGGRGVPRGRGRGGAVYGAGKGRGRYVGGGSDSDDEDATGDFSRLGLGGFRRAAEAVSSAKTRMVFVSAGIQSGTIDETLALRLEREAHAPADMAAEAGPSKDDDEGEEGEEGEEEEEEGEEEGEDEVDGEGYSYADMQKILAMDLGDRDQDDSAAFAELSSSDEDGSSSDEDDSSDGSSEEDTGEDDSEEGCGEEGSTSDENEDDASTDGGEEQQGDEEEEGSAAGNKARGLAKAAAAAHAGGALPSARARAPARSLHGGASAAPMSADELLTFFVSQPALLSMALVRPGKSALGALAWRADDLNVEVVSEGANSIVLTKVGPCAEAAGGSARARRTAGTPSSARGAKGRKPELQFGELDRAFLDFSAAAAAGSGSGSALEKGGKRARSKGGGQAPHAGLSAAAGGSLAEYKGLGGKKTLPKHLKKQLKAARRVRAQELDFAAQRRLLHEVLALSGGLDFGGRKGKAYGGQNRRASGGPGRAHSEPRSRHFGGGGKRGGFASPDHDAATRLTTTRHLAAIGEDNKGHQMLTSMGWAGGALRGCAAEGLSTPLTVDVRKGRRGLGHDTV